MFKLFQPQIIVLNIKVHASLTFKHARNVSSLTYFYCAGKTRGTPRPVVTWMRDQQLITGPRAVTSEGRQVIVVYCTLYCTVLYCTVLYCILYCTVLYTTTSYFIMAYYSDVNTPLQSPGSCTPGLMNFSVRIVVPQNYFKLQHCHQAEHK